MYTLHSASLPPYDAELSRHAAERYAVLNAVKEQRSAKRRFLRPARSVQPAPHLVAPATGR